MNIKKMKISELIPANYNPRKDLTPDDKEYQKLKKSIEEFGYVEPIICNKSTGVVVGGHQRLKVLKDLGWDEVDCVVVDLDDTKEKALNIALNKISGEWQFDKLKDLLQELDTGEIDLELTGFDMSEIEDMMTQFNDDIENNQEETNNTYTDKIKIPIYEPTGETPNITDLVDESKTKVLIKNIENSNLSNDLKNFLKLSAYRHLVFNYKNIAEYYANTNKEEQELFEQSALVIIDFGKAIENGFVDFINESIKECGGEDE